MDLKTFLAEHGGRLELGNSWIVWEPDAFVIYTRKPYAKKSNVVAYANDINLAIDRIIEHEN